MPLNLDFLQNAVTNNCFTVQNLTKHALEAGFPGECNETCGFTVQNLTKHVLEAGFPGQCNENYGFTLQNLIKHAFEAGFPGECNEKCASDTESVLISYASSTASTTASEDVAMRELIRNVSSDHPTIPRLITRRERSKWWSAYGYRPASSEEICKHKRISSPPMYNGPDIEASPFKGGCSVPANAPRLRIMCASANVQTLLPHQEGCSYFRNSAAMMYSKVEMMEQQFRDRGIGVVGIQEVRARRQERRDGVYYIMLISAADEFGALGVQCWIDRELNLHILQWKAVSSRLLFVVTVTPQGAVAIFLSGHSPTLHAKDDDKLNFWSSLSTVVGELMARFPNAFWSLVIDANGRVGSVPSTAIGRHEAANEDSNGAYLRQLAEDFNFAVVNTFYEAGPTWRSTRGHWHRIDCILIRASHLKWNSNTSVAQDIDLTFNSHIDHLTVGADFEVEQAGLSSGPRPRTTRKINKSMINDPVARE